MKSLSQKELLKKAKSVFETLPESETTLHCVEDGNCFLEKRAQAAKNYAASQGQPNKPLKVTAINRAEAFGEKPKEAKPEPGKTEGGKVVDLGTGSETKEAKEGEIEWDKLTVAETAEVVQTISDVAELTKALELADTKGGKAAIADRIEELSKK